MFGRLQHVLATGGWSTRTVRLLSVVEDTSASEPLPGMYDGAKVIWQVLDGTDGEAIVVAHSYGGVPVIGWIAPADETLMTAPRLRGTISAGMRG
ncbi:hypothetical protein [Streptomyces sp. OE57]|uniref:hypothetical protein n=1 Tax=Streptomyces lacaronensis TaxID=3379885 RepID=UPI0039B77C09